jgi:ubiquinone/menaquinone biosynthesis C-methylase UbiE
VREQRYVFDEVAATYERTRPGYPAALFGTLVAFAHIAPPARLLELGSGTGKGTEWFAAHGYRVLCLEPGASLARIARRKFASIGTIEVVESSLEAWRVEPAAFDLAYAAQSFHWLPADQRFVKPANALRPRGTLAVIGNVSTIEASPVERALSDAYAQLAPDVDRGRSAWFGRAEAIEALFRASGRFGPVTHRVFPWSRTMAVDAYIDLLRTHSDHRMLEDAVRDALLSEVRRVVERHGGAMTLRYDAHLHMARRQG